MKNNTIEPISLDAYRYGIKLTAEYEKLTDAHPIFNQDFNCYLLDDECKTLMMNPLGAIAIGFDSVEDACGRSILTVSDKHSGKRLFENSMEVYHQERMSVTEETQVKINGQMNSFLSFKMPLYNQLNHLIGSFGCSIILGQHPLLASLNKLSTLLPDINFGKLANIYQNPLEVFNLSLRQQQCLSLAIRGKTAKQTAKLTGLSYRTVEEYLDNVKRKMNVASKAEMIEIAISLLLPELRDID